jgi:hypothetical protein
LDAGLCSFSARACAPTRWQVSVTQREREDSGRQASGNHLYSTSGVSIGGSSGSNLTNALSQLSGEPATGAQKVGFQLTDQFLNLMLDPFVDGRSGVAGADHPALGFAPERETMPPDIAHAYAAVLKPPPKAVPVYEPRWTMWGGAYGGSNRTTGDLAVIGSHDLSAVRKQGGDQRHVRNSVEPAGPREATGQRH